MQIIRIENHDTESQEAVVEITIPVFIDGEGNCEEFHVKTFCQPFILPCANFSIALYGFGVSNVWLEEHLEKPIKTDHGYFSYRLSARVIDVSTQHVKLGDFDFYLDVPFPKDIKEGMLVSFDVQRIDTSFVH